MPRTCALGVAMLKLCRLIALPAALVAVLLFLSSGQESPARAQFDDPDGDGYADGFESLWGSDGLDGTSTPESLAHDFYFGTTSCSDGSDNDGDGSTDAADSGCTNTDADTDFLGGPLDDGMEVIVGSDATNAASTVEYGLFDEMFGGDTCSDPSDNDLDTLIDSADPGCQDADFDGIVDGADNCPFVYNPGQEDADSDGIGNACDPDFVDSDGDGIDDASDNCPSDFNPGQEDADSDGIGNACDLDFVDSDGDGIDDASDNCPSDFNPGQEDADGDGIGNACDPDFVDSDFDGIPDGADNCPFVYNPGQEDADSDGIGNACDPDFVDSDGDGIVDGADNCPSVYNPGQEDANGFEDGAGAGDACEDPDGDGIVNAFDNCPNDANPGQEDSDFDGVGDACDTDADNDGVPDATDNCPFVYNPGQEDADSDGIGNACDPDFVDSDGDGIVDASDNCPTDFNPGQEDADGNGTGDVCEVEWPSGSPKCIDGIDNDSDTFVDGDDTGCTSAPDSKGAGFWLAFPDNYRTTAELSLFITGDVNTTGLVTIPGLGYFAPFSVTGGTVTTVSLPPAANIDTSDLVGNLGIRVSAQDEVTVYGLNRIQYTTDAYLGLPTDILGTEYVVLGFKNVNIVNGTEFAIVAPADATTVTITPSVTTGPRLAGIPYDITLNEGQTYQLKNQGLS